MNKQVTYLFVLIFSLLFLIKFPVNAQDLVPFEVVDNESVGLTVTPFEKWGMAIHDIDRNGYPDIFCLRWKSPGYSRIFVNNEAFFQDITSQSPIEAIETEETGTRTTLWVDYDNDGDRDLSMSTDDALHLLRNDNNEFTDVAEEMGFVGQKPPGFIANWEYTIGGWADYDLDGDLDCVVSQINNQNLYLFRNDGDHFTNVATEAGLDSTTLAENSRLTWQDIDLDGDPDLYSTMNFFRNDDGVFTEITEELGFADLQEVSYREFFDYDNDGDFDFFKSVSSANAVTTSEIWRNEDGVFVNATEDVGLTISRDRYRSMTIGDFENDGDKDIFLQLNIDPSLDVLLVNDEVGPGDHVFSDVAEFVGISKTGDRKGSAFFDYDRDGFLDIYLPSAEHNHILYHNLGGNDANWVGFILEGTASNRDAVGSLVTLYTADKKQICYTKCGNGFLRQDNPWVHFGIGLATEIDSVVIRWPLGYKQLLTDVAINQYHEIKEPDQTVVQTRDDELHPSTFQLDQNYPNPFNPSTNLSYHIPRATNVQLNIYDVNGRKVKTLVNSPQQVGHYKVIWNGNDDANNRLASGVYMYQLKAGNVMLSKKMVLVK